MVATDLKLPFNKARMTTIKRSVIDYGLWEAFLEAAPQFLFQMAILPDVEMRKLSYDLVLEAWWKSVEKRN
jgi:hypothetical protein